MILHPKNNFFYKHTGMSTKKINFKALLKELHVIYEDNHLIAVNKRPGHLVHGDKTGDVTLADIVKLYIKEKYNKPGDVFLGVIHRLDRPVSGVTVFARTSKGLTRMNELIKNREIEKIYVAITKERPDPITGTLTNFMIKDNAKNVSKIIPGKSKRNPDAKKAVLDYEFIGGMDAVHLTKIMLKTGRSHQIRVQLASIGCSIIGDLKYGFPTANRNGSIYLHCSKMEFIHPVKKVKVKIVAKVPKDMIWNKFRSLIKSEV